ncbi:hypothetical protein HMPREF1548_03470 [Clostridium sp. KLE 1755]|nr:hypothetical protein HMPREF1548_03470 [Clostridium sp. KLE 1755]
MGSCGFIFPGFSVGRGNDQMTKGPETKIPGNGLTKKKVCYIMTPFIGG